MNGGPRDWDTIKSMLVDQVDALVAEIYPNARRVGHWQCVGDVSGTPGQSLRVNCGAGAHRGCWKDYNGGETGSLLDLIQARFGFQDIGEAATWARKFLNIDGWTDADRERQARDALRQKKLRAEAQVKEDQAARHQAQRLWGRACHARKDMVFPETPAGLYLRDTRGLDVARLPRVPGALAFLPDVVCRDLSDFDARPKRIVRRPAMLAAIVRPNGAGRAPLIGVHRTFLREVDGYWVKDPELEYPKKVLGRAQGGWIPLGRGRENRSVPALSADDCLYLAEGIENALTMALVAQDRGLPGAVAAYVFGGNLGFVAETLPMAPLCILGRDNDRPGSDGAKRFDRNAAKFAARRQVRVVAPDYRFKDFNDALLSRMRPGEAA